MKHEKFKKMLEKKRPLSDNEKHAKMNVLKELRDMAANEMGHKLGGIKKVSVASDSSEGLQHGLDKAKEIVSPETDEHEEQYSEGGEVESEESPEQEASENPEEEHDEFHGLDMDQIKEKIQKLMSLKDKMEGQS